MVVDNVPEGGVLARGPGIQTLLLIRIFGCGRAGGGAYSGTLPLVETAVSLLCSKEKSPANPPNISPGTTSKNPGTEKNLDMYSLTSSKIPLSSGPVRPHPQCLRARCRILYCVCLFWGRPVESWVGTHVHPTRLQVAVRPTGLAVPELGSCLTLARRHSLCLI